MCSLQENQFRGVEYSASVADFFVPGNLRPVAQWHPHITDVVYWGKYYILTIYKPLSSQGPFILGTASFHFSNLSHNIIYVFISRFQHIFNLRYSLLCIWANHQWLNVYGVQLSVVMNAVNNILYSISAVESFLITSPYEMKTLVIELVHTYHDCRTGVAD